MPTRRHINTSWDMLTTFTEPFLTVVDHFKNADEELACLKNDVP